MSNSLLFSVTVDKSDDGSVVFVDARREDGVEKTWAFPEKKLRVFRALNGEVGRALAFLLGER